MDAFLLDFINLLLRWLHLVAAIAWIGESIYFVMLDNSLRAPDDAGDKERGIFGEMWAVHGGGFYHNQKYLTQPPKLPADLHWSFWKAYTTWLSGFALFAALYLLKPDFYLVNTASPWKWAASLTGFQASVLAVAFLALGWVIYDQLCRRISPNMERDGVLSVAVALMMVLVAWLATQMFQGRAAFLITGAVMATAMSANVFFWIIPGQRRMVRALQSGAAVNPLDGKRGKQRSVHNTYFTLPVVLLMLSNHYAFIFNSPHSWVIMSAFIFSGALIRQYFVLRHAGTNQLAYPTAGIALIALAGWLAMPGGAENKQLGKEGATAGAMLAIHEIVQNRCVQCHAANPVMAGFSAPPAGIRLDTTEQIVAHAARIKLTVANRYMPLGNVTQMTDDERDIIAGWHP